MPSAEITVEALRMITVEHIRGHFGRLTAVPAAAASVSGLFLVERRLGQFV